MTFRRLTTPKDLYYDVIRELDWSVGQIVQRLRDHGIEQTALPRRPRPEPGLDRPETSQRHDHSRPG